LGLGDESGTVSGDEKDHYLSESLADH